jgi:2,4-dienoyl-CoA reductase (NADPH2)
LSSFLSPWTNRRTDGYGGSLKKRARFSLEVVEAIKADAGKAFPLVVRMCADELMPEGNSPDDLRTVASMLQGAGVDALSLTVGWHESTVPAITGEISRGHWLYLAEKMKKAVRIPVMMAYRVTHTEAEKAIQEGAIDFWEASRPFIADPQLPRKLAENRPEDIVPCICCCQGCYDSVFQGLPIWCVVNPRASRESDTEYAITPSENPRKVMVIGGGPAGMEAGIIASMRGHHVTLLEKENRLGGNLLASSIPPFKHDFSELSEYLIGQVGKRKIAVKLNSEVAAQAMDVGENDAVIMATGASPLLPDLPGIHGENVLTALDVLLDRRQVAKRAIVVGGGMVGCETAEFLRKKGKEVIVLEMLDKVAGDMGPTLRWRLLARLKEGGVRIETKVRVTGIVEGGVEGFRDGQKMFFEADAVILAAGMKPNNLLAQKLKLERAVFYQVGDCWQPRKLGEAIQEAFFAAAKI